MVGGLGVPGEAGSPRPVAVELPVYSITGAEGGPVPALRLGVHLPLVCPPWPHQAGLPDWAQHIQGAGAGARDRNC